MRNCLLVLIAGVMLCVPLGCNQGGDEEPATYERDVDGPPVALYSSMLDYEIIGDPAEVARRRQLFQEGVEDTDKGDVGSGDLTGPEGDASEDEIAEVKDVIAQIMATADAGDETVALALFDENAGAAVQSLTGGLEALQALLGVSVEGVESAAALNRLIRSPQAQALLRAQSRLEAEEASLTAPQEAPR